MGKQTGRVRRSSEAKEMKRSSVTSPLCFGGAGRGRCRREREREKRKLTAI